jgi:hypothetical protein
MASKVTRVGSLDIQFQQNWEMAKGNQLVQSLQQTISAVNQANVAIAELQMAGGKGGNVTAPVLIATTGGLGPQVSVGPGLLAGQVLIAVSDNNAAFGQLQFGEIAQTNPASFAAPVEGDVIMFHTGFWTAMPDPNAGLGLSDPGQNALVMWNEAGHAFAWAIPAAGGGIKLSGGAIAVDATQLDHSKLEGLHFTVANPAIVANDHPQYVMLAAANTWPLLQTFAAGIVSNADITLAGNFEQSGAEPEWRIRNTDDTPDEGTWRMHAEPGQLIFSTVSDDGADGENWLCVTRIGEIADAVNVSSNSFTWNGDNVLTAASLAPGTAVNFTTNPAGQLVINAGSAGSSLTVTDGTHTVAGTTSLTVTGAVVGGSTPNATLTISGASAAVPGTIADLVLWWTSSNILGSSGAIVQLFQQSTPWITGVLASNATSVTGMSTIDATPLNGLNIIKIAAVSPAIPVIKDPINLTAGNVTFFVVVRPNTAVTASAMAIIGSNGNGGLAFYMNSAASVAKVGLTKTGTAVIGSSTATWTNGVAFQANATYAGASGNFAFRQARTAAGSGTGATGAGTTPLTWIGADQTISGGILLAHSIAEIIMYQRVLSGTEITNVENYLFAKWAV